MSETALPQRKPLATTTLDGLPPELAASSKYEVLSKLGEGGMGAVYKARHTFLNEMVAIKVMNAVSLSNPDARSRFLREMQSAGQLKHKNIVRALDAEEMGELLVLVMEYVEGITLDRLVAQKGTLPVAYSCQCIARAALGLQYAHEKGMVHRDIKPANIIVATSEKEIKLLDFGLARGTREQQAKDNHTQIGVPMGTPAYMAPEQVTDASSVDIRADVYSLGCTLYYLLAGQSPFQRDSAMTSMMAQVSDEARPMTEVRTDVPADLWAVMAKMLAKKPEDRYQTPKDVEQALRQFATGGAKTEQAVGERAKAKMIDAATLLPGNTSELKPAPLPVPTLSPSRKQPAAVPAEKTSLAVLSTSVSAAGRGRRKKAKGKKPWLNWNVWAAAAFAAVLIGLWAGGVIRVRTLDGVLVLNVNEPNPDVYVDGDMVTVTWDNGGKKAEIRIKPGTRKVEVKKDGFSMYGEDVEVKDGERKIFTARLDPPPPHKPAARDPLALDLGGGVTVQFVRVPKGTFWMGWTSDKKQSRQVTIDTDFELGAYMVTQEQWKALMLDNPSYFSRFGMGKDKVANVSGADLKRFPVENVSWDDAQVFLRKLNTREDGKGWLYRLPKETEWEYACRNAATTLEKCSFDFYFDRGTNDLSSNQANFNGNFPAGHATRGPFLEIPAKVGSYAPNKLGLYDMHGNVGEWCDNQWNDNKKDPGRVTRGGTWVFRGQFCRAGTRFRGMPAIRHGDLGLRLARVPVGKENKEATTMPPGADGVVPLFNGKDLTGWRIDGGKESQWTVEGGTIISRSPGWEDRTYLLSNRDYSDFMLCFEFRVENESQGGVAIRAVEGEKLPLGKSAIFDHPFIKLSDPKQNATNPTGRALWLKRTAFVRPDEILNLPTGTWNSMEVFVQGDVCKATVGGKQLLNLTLDPDTRNHGGFVPALARQKGKVGFQVHIGTVRYRNIEIKELSAPAAK